MRYSLETVEVNGHFDHFEYIGRTGLPAAQTNLGTRRALRSREPARVISVHGPHALSGVTTWITKLLEHSDTRHEWHALVVGSERDCRQAEAFPATATGRVHVRKWSNDELAVTDHVDLVREALRELRADVVMPNYVPEAYAAAGLEVTNGMHTIGVCHSRDYWYLELFQHAGQIMHGAWAVSKECEDLIRSALGDHVAVLCAPYGMSLPNDTTPPPLLSRGDARIRLLYCGRLESQQKRSLRLADLADELHGLDVSFELTIAGDGPDKAKLEERTRLHQDRGSVRFVGAVSHAEIEQLIDAHDALVLVSAFEGTPLAAIEAMAHGRPVFITDGCGGAVDAVRQFGGGVIAPADDLRSMANKIKAVCTDPVEFERTAALARSTAQRCFTLDKHVEEIERLVDRTLDSRGVATIDSARRAWRAISNATSLAIGGWPEHIDRKAFIRWRRTFLKEQSHAIANAKARRGRVRSLITRAQLWMAVSSRAPSIDRLGASLLQSAVDELAQEGLQRIAVFPAGRHSRRHGHVLREKPAVACFVDDAPASSIPGTLHEKAVLKPDAAIVSGIDAIVVSSDMYEEALEARAREWGGDVPVRTLYVPVRIPRRAVS